MKQSEWFITELRSALKSRGHWAPEEDGDEEEFIKAINDALDSTCRNHKPDPDADIEGDVMEGYCSSCESWEVLDEDTGLCEDCSRQEREDQILVSMGR